MAEDANAQIRVDIDTTAALASIKNLQRQISAFHSQMLASGNAANAALSQNMQKTLVNSINATGKFAASLTNIKTSAETFTTSLEKNKLGLREYFRYAGASTKSFGKLFTSEFSTIEKVARERVKTLQTQYIKMGRDANGALQAIKVRPLSLDMQNLGTQTAMAAQKQMLLNQLIKQGTTNLVNWGKNVQWAGRQLMVGFTLPLAVLGTAAAKSFMELEKQAVRFKRVYGEMFTSSGETEKALDNVRELANEFTKYGVAVEKTLGLAADLAQQGLTGVALMTQVTQATRLAVLGEVEQQEALQTTISITNAFGIAAEDLASKINFLNAVENQTITAIEDLTIAIPKAGPVVQQLGGDVEDLAFFLTAMKEGGINASEGANALKSGLASLINPSEKASEFLGDLGVNIKGIVDANKGDVQGIVVEFAKALDDLDPLDRAKAIEQLFGKFQFSRLSTLFQNVIKEGSQANRVLQLGQQTAEELAVLADRELKKVEDSPAFKFQKAIEDITVAIAPLGEQFLKLITPIVEFVTEMLKKFNDMSEGSKTFVVGLIATLGLVAPVVLMTVGLVANGVGNLIKGFNALRVFYNKLGGDSTGLASSTQYLTQEQLEAAAVAASLGQSHAQLAQIFTSETQAVQGLIAAYQQAVIAANALSAVAPVARARPDLTISTNSRGGRRVQAPQGYADGVLSVPGPKGAGDVVPAMLSPGEAVIPAEQTKKYGPLIAGIVADSIPGYMASNVKKSPRTLDLDDLSSLTPEELKALKSYGKVTEKERRRTPEAATSIERIKSVEGIRTKPEDVQKRLARLGVSPVDSLKVMSNLAEAATTQTVEAYEEYVEAIKSTYETGAKKLDGTVKNSKQFRKQVKENANFVSKNDPLDAPNLMHVGEGTSVSGKEAADLNRQGKLAVSPSDLKKILANPEAKIDIKSLFGADNFDNILNKRLAGAGISAEEYSGGLEDAGPEKWNKSIKLVGGNLDELTDELLIFDESVQSVTDSVPKTTVVFDSQAKAEEQRAKKIAAISTQEINSEAIRRVKDRIPNLLPLIEKAASTPGEVRGVPIGIEADSNRRDLSNGLGNTQLAQRAKEELNRAFPIEEIQQLTQASSVASQEISDQSTSNSNLATSSSVAEQGINELGNAATNLGQKAAAASAQMNAGGPRRAQADQGPPTTLTASKTIGANKGLLSVPGPKGAGDVVPAMLSPGEAVIPAKMAARYAPFIQDMIAGNIPGFMSGVFLGMPKSSKSVSKGRTAGDEIYQRFKSSSYANTPPTEYGHQISPTSGHSFPIFNLGGVYQKGPKQVFVKPMMDETAALAEMRATTIARQAHGLKAPEQRIVVIRDPMDVKRERRFLALESDLDPTFVNTQPMGVFNEEQYFRQLAASLLRADKDLSPSNVYGDVVADVGPAGVFDRASGFREYSSSLPSMEDQALINLLGIKGGAKRAFAESTLGLMAGLTPEQYHQRMIAEIQKVLPRLKETIASFKLTNPTDVGMYDDMVRRLEAGLSVDWSKFHSVHSSVVIPKPKKIKEPAGYANGVVSVPGPKGAGDVVPAMLSPGEAVIPTAMAEKYGPLINAMISGNIPGYFKGTGKVPPPTPPGSRSYSGPSKPMTGKFAPPELNISVVPDEQEFESAGKKLGNTFIDSSAKGLASNKITKGLFTKYFENTEAKRQKAQEVVQNRSMASRELLFATDEEYKALAMQEKAYQERGLGLEKTEAQLNQEYQQHLERKKVLNEKEKLMVEEMKNADSEEKLIKDKISNAQKRGTMNDADAAGIQSQIVGTASGKAARDQRKADRQAKIQQFAGKMSQAGMMGSMAVGAASMVPGAVGETAQKLAAPIMALSTLSMFIQGPWTAGIVAAVAVIGSLWYVQDQLTQSYQKAQVEAVRLGQAIGGSTDAIRSLAEFSGKVTAGEVAEKRREDKFRLMAVAPGKTTFGESFMQDDSGIALLKDLKLQVANSGGDTSSALKSVSSQLQMAVVSGALSQDQAGSIASQIGVELNDASFGVKVRAQITELIGINGEDLQNNELVIATRLVETSERNMENSRNAMDTGLRSMPADLQTQGDRNTSAAMGVLGTAATGAIAGATIASVIPIPVITQLVGGVVGGAIGLIGGVIGQMSIMEEMSRKAGAFAGAYVADISMALQQQNEIMAVLDQNYAKKLDEAAVEGDITEYKRLQVEYEEKKRDLTAVTAKLNDGLITQYDQMSADGNTAGTEAIMTGVKNATNAKFAEDPTALQYMPLVDQQLDQAVNKDKTLTGGQELLIRQQLLSGMDPATLTQLLSSGDITKVVNIMANLGGPMASEVAGVANMIKDEKVSADFVLSVEQAGTNSTEAQKLIDLATSIQALGGDGVLENSVNTVFTAIMDDSMASDAITKAMEGLDATEVETVEQVYDIVPEFNVDEKYAEAFNEEYFATLQSNAQRETYVLASKIIMEIPEATVLASADFLKWTGDVGAKYGAYPGDKYSKAQWHQFYADSMAQKVTTSGVVLSGKGAAEEEEPKGGGGGGPAASPLDDITKRLRDVRKSQVGVTKGFDASSSAIDKLFGGGKGINLFDGLEQSMRKYGAGEDLISVIAGMDPEEFDKKKNLLFNFDKQTGAIIGFKDKLMNVGKALSAIALGDYVNNQQKSTKESKNQVAAFDLLRSAGYSVADAYEAVQDASLAAALASGNVTRAQMDTMLAELKAAQDAMKEAARLTPEGLQEVFEDGFNKAMEAFDAKEKKLTLEYELQIADDEALVKDAENQIAAIRYQMDDYEADLRGIQDQENSINDTYDEKLEALEKVRTANQRILDQEKGKLSVAEAITRGDLAAAARAVQDVRQTSASGYFADQTDALDAGRQSALDAVRSENGLSRVEIEEKIKDLSDQIFQIEESTLEPAQERIRLAGIELQARIDELTELGKTRTEWETIKNSIDVSRVNSVGYKEAMTEALSVVEDVRDAWNGINNRTVTLTTIQETLTEGQASSAKPAGPSSGSTPPPAAKPRPKPVVASHGSLLGGGPYAVSAGGLITGPGTGTSDSIPAMLSDGEYVIRAAAAKKIGLKMLDQLNSGKPLSMSDMASMKDKARRLKKNTRPDTKDIKRGFRKDLESIMPTIMPDTKDIKPGRGKGKDLIKPRLPGLKKDIDSIMPITKDIKPGVIKGPNSIIPEDARKRLQQEAEKRKLQEQEKKRRLQGQVGRPNTKDIKAGFIKRPPPLKPMLPGMTKPFPMPQILPDDISGPTSGFFYNPAAPEGKPNTKDIKLPGRPDTKDIKPGFGKPGITKPFMPQIIPDDDMMYAGGTPGFYAPGGPGGVPANKPAFSKPSFNIPSISVPRPPMPQIPSAPSFRPPSEPLVSTKPIRLPDKQPPTKNSSSVYNYSLNLNVASQSDPNAIAQTVMNQIQTVDSQRIRGGRF
jgi:TP901 family phage tail tape measure protein